MKSGQKKKKESDLAKQSATSIKRGMRSLQKKKELHESKIANPRKYIPEWDTYPEKQQNGLITHWKKEIRDFTKSIQNRINELKERDEYDE